jgi:predicted NUDIX family NTP pyrophosphohydrolase
VTSKASRLSAGLLLYRLREGRLEVFIAHMGGPFWASKDERG